MKVTISSRLALPGDDCGTVIAAHRVWQVVVEDVGKWAKEIESRPADPRNQDLLGINEQRKRIVRQLRRRSWRSICTELADLMLAVRASDDRIIGPLVKTGAAVRIGQRIGHTQTHGSDAEKRERWQAVYDDWQAEKRAGTPKAAEVVAVRHSVSPRQVYRTAKYLGVKND